MSKHLPYLQYVGLGIIFLSLAARPAAASDPTPEAALADLNAWRAEAGLLPVNEMRPDWNEGCRLHNQYRALQGDGASAHVEDPASPYYTKAGDEAGRSSVLRSDQSLPKDGWAYAIYHRVQLLSPRLNVSGFDASNGHSCMRTVGIEDPTRRPPAIAYYPWPPDGAQEVPTTFVGGEIPDPRANDPNGGDMGYLLSVNLNGPWEFSFLAKSVTTGATLTSDGGTAVPVVSQDIYPRAIGLFPADPLLPETGYTAHVTGYVSVSAWGTPPVQYPVDYAWRFRTESSTPLTPNREPRFNRHKRRRHCHRHGTRKYCHRVRPGKHRYCHRYRTRRGAWRRHCHRHGKTRHHRTRHGHHRR